MGYSKSFKGILLAPLLLAGCLSLETPEKFKVLEKGKVELKAVAPDETKLWIITEAADDAGVRVATTMLLPDEY